MLPSEAIAMKQLLLVALLLMLLNAEKTAAWSPPQPFIIASTAQGMQDITRFAELLQDNRQRYESELIVSGKADSLFSRGISISGDKEECSFWVKLNCRSQLNNRSTWILETDKRYGNVDAYIVHADGKTEVQKSGWNVPPAKRTIVDPDVIFKLSADVKETVTIYLHVRTNLSWSAIDKLQLKLIPEAYWNKTALKVNSFLAVYSGFCLLAIFYWLITFIYSRRTNYLLLIAATLSAMLFCVDLYGITGYVWNDYPWYSLVKYGEQTIWFPFMVTSYFAIAYRTNPFREHFSGLVIFSYWFLCLVTDLLLVFAPLFLSWHNARILSLSTVLVCVAGGVVLINLLLFKKGHKDAAFGFLTILPILAGMSIYILSTLDILPEPYKIYAPIGAFSTVIMFFYGMVIYVRVLRQKRKRESMENERLIREQNTMLEREVANRTLELSVANSELAKTLDDLRYAQTQLIKAEKQKENEIIRGRISQDIHDDVSSELTRISWISELAKANALKGEVDQMPALLDKINSSSKETVTKLGEIIWAINPNSDTMDNLLSYMRSYISKYLAETQIKYTINFPDADIDMPMSPEIKRNLFLVLKEAMNNALKYSQASAINVDLKLEGRNYSLHISDNGIGIDEHIIHGGGNGLPNMRRRMQQIRGLCIIESGLGKGTSVMLTGSIY
jgi:signal transduction histidine kinase